MTKPLATRAKTKIQRAIDYIHAHPGCRTPELATAIDVDRSAVFALLRDPIMAGLIFSCKVERRGQAETSEFRLCVSVGNTSPDWHEWRREHAPTGGMLRSTFTRPRLPVRHHNACVTTQAGSGDITPAAPDRAPSLRSLSRGAGAVVEPPTPDAPPAAAGSDETLGQRLKRAVNGNREKVALVAPGAHPPLPATLVIPEPQTSPPFRSGGFRITLDDDGYLETERGGRTLATSHPDEALAMADFLSAFASFWRP